MQLSPQDIIHRFLGPGNRFHVQWRIETWAGTKHIPTMHIALYDTNTEQIVRFEEDPNTFPSDALVDKLRCLR